jgi:hypothetical protein
MVGIAGTESLEPIKSPECRKRTLTDKSCYSRFTASNLYGFEDHKGFGGYSPTITKAPQ